jgi:hypothetical protein
LTCPSGTFADTNTVGIKLVTKHTCGDASGAFDSFLRAVGPQTWRFAGGTSAYSTLRGHGQCQIAEGPPITRTCQFLAAFDDVAPTGTVSKFTVSRAPGKRAYAVHTSFTAHDDVAGTPSPSSSASGWEAGRSRRGRGRPSAKRSRSCSRSRRRRAADS